MELSKKYDEKLNKELLTKLNVSSSNDSIYLELYKNNAHQLANNLVYEFKGLISYDEILGFIYENIKINAHKYDSNQSSYISYLKEGTRLKVSQYLHYCDLSKPIHVPVKKRAENQVTSEDLEFHDFHEDSENPDMEFLMDLLDEFEIHVKNEKYPKSVTTSVKIFRLLAEGHTKVEIGKMMGLTDVNVGAKYTEGLKILQIFAKNRQSF